MYGYGTVVYHFGRVGSARAMYTPAFSQAACHFGSNRRKSNGSVGRAGFETRRAGGPRRGRASPALRGFGRGRGFTPGGDGPSAVGAPRGAQPAGSRPAGSGTASARRANGALPVKRF